MDGGAELEKFGREGLKWVWDNAEDILKRLARLRGWLKGRKADEQSVKERGSEQSEQPGILIVGPGGVGKTTVARLLAGKSDDILSYDSDLYRESLVVENFKLDDQSEIGIVVLPGQEHRRSGTWGDYLTGIAAGKFKGIIVLTAFGYHTFGIPYKEHKIYQALSRPRTKAQFLKRYLEDRRADEAKVLRGLSEHVQKCPGKLWILNLVAKQDLWWPERNSVSDHYLHGPAGLELNGVLGQHDPRLRRYETAFASLIINNFSDGMNTVLCPNAAGYDHRLQLNSLRRLVETVYNLMEWEQTDGDQNRKASR
jgi:hypothetical protein